MLTGETLLLLLQGCRSLAVALPLAGCTQAACAAIIEATGCDDLFAEVGHDDRQVHRPTILGLERRLSEMIVAMRISHQSIAAASGTPASLLEVSQPPEAHQATNDWALQNHQK